MKRPASVSMASMFACPAPGCSGVLCRVVDSRMRRDGHVRTRRRRCLKCGLRFITCERVQDASGDGAVTGRTAGVELAREREAGA